MVQKTLGIIIICVLFLFPLNVYSSSIKEDYELQERCGKQCKEFFEKEYGNGLVNNNNGQTIFNYTNHYNRKMNKCFFLLTSTLVPKDTKKDSNRYKSIYDFNENKEFGLFWKRSKDTEPSGCMVSGKVCKSESEWDLLVKPYMEE